MELLTVDEVANITRMTAWTVRYWLEKGHLKGKKVGAGTGGRWRIDKKDLEKFVNKNCN